MVRRDEESQLGAERVACMTRELAAPRHIGQNHGSAGGLRVGARVHRCVVLC
jgi:hypothetical protein